MCIRDRASSWGAWGYRSYYWKAVIQIHMGNTNAALDWLDKSYEHREFRTDSFEPPLNFVLLDESWDSVHDDPRFKAILEKIGFTKVMRPKS